MPSTLNGFGTMYYGKSNRYVYEDVCEFCGYQGNLKTYDTGYFITAVFIPIIPLGTQHIMSECPSCKRHKRISLRKIEKMKQEIVADIRAEMTKGVPDSQNVIDDLRSLYSFRDPLAFKSIAFEVIEKCKSRVTVMSELSELFCFFHDVEQALACAVLAHRLSDSNEQKELVAEMLIYNKKPHEAEQYVEHLWESGNPNSFWLSLFLAEGFCTIADYNAAENVQKKVEATYRGEEYKEAIELLRERIEKGRQSGKASYSSRISAMDEPFEGPKKASKKSMLVLPLILLAAFGIYLISSFYMQFNKTIYLVNGTSKKYVVSLNGKSHTLLPFSKRRVTLSEGVYTLTTDALDSARNLQQFEIKSNLLTRPFSEGDKTYIINPDHCALLHEIDVEYGIGASSEAVYRHRSLGLKHIFLDIDYVFTSFPDSVELSSGTRIETKTGLDMIKNLGDISPLVASFSVLSPDSSKLYIEKYATAVPHDEHAMRTYVYSDTTKALNYLKPLILEQPLYVEAHRVYQDFLRMYQPDYDIYAEYAQYLTEDSLNAQLLYLVGRVADDSVADDFFRRSISQNDPSPYAFNALAISEYNAGNFDNGRKYAQKAHSLSPKNENFSEMYQMCLHGSGKFETLLTTIDENIAKESLTFSNYLYKYEVLLTLGRIDEAEELAQDYCEKLERKGYTDLSNYKTTFSIYRAIFEGNKSTLKSLFKKNSYYSVYDALLNSDFKTFDSAVETESQTGYESNLLAYIIAENKSDKSSSKRYLESAIADMEQQGAHLQEYVQLLKNNSNDRAVDEPFESSYTDNALFYTVLGMKYPQKREAFFKKARKYNYRVSLQKSILDVVL